MTTSSTHLPAGLIRKSAPQRQGTGRPWRLQIISGEEDFLALEPFWNRLLEQSATRTPFLQWDWVRFWWETFREDFRLAIGVVRDAMGQPVAIAPCVLGLGGGSRRFMRHLAFIGGLGPVRGEGMDFLIAQGMEKDLAPVLGGLFGALRSRWDVALLMMVPDSSPNLPWIVDALQAVGAGRCAVQRRVSPYLVLPRNWQELEMQHSASWRSTHRRKWNKALTAHQGRMLLAGRDMPAERAFDALVALHRHRFDERQSAFLNPRALSFHRRLVGRWMEERRIQLTLLELDGSPQAATYCLVDGGKAAQYQAGWHPRFASLSVGRLAMGCAIQEAMDRGLREFDFLPGDGPHKRLWTQQTRHLDDLECFHPHSLRARLFRALRAVGRRLRRAKSADLSPEACPASEAGSQETSPE